MVLGFLALTACGGGAPPAVAETTDPPVETLFVDVSARVVEVGEPSPWTVRAAWGGPASPPPLAAGVCRRPRSDMPVGAPGAEELAIAGARLAWQPASGGAPGTGAWGAVGPRQVLDPAWSVADVAWSDPAGARHVADDIVRFGGVPDVTRVMRDREGAVSVRWDPATVGATEVRVTGPAGALVCGTTTDGTTLPWWVVPAYGGEVVLESVRENSALVDGVLVRVRTTLARVIRLDEPAGTTAEEEAPAFRPYTSHGPRRVVRPPRHPLG